MTDVKHMLPAMTEATKKDTFTRDLPNGWQVHRLEGGAWFVLEPNGRGHEVECSLSGFFDTMFADSAVSKSTDQDPEVLRQKAQLWEGAKEISEELGYPSVTAALEALEKTRLRMAELQGRCGGLEATINEIAEQGESVAAIDIVNLAKGIAKSNLCATPDAKASTGAMVDIEKLRRDLEYSVDSLTSNLKKWEVHLFLELPHQGASEIDTVDAYLKSIILPSTGKDGVIPDGWELLPEDLRTHLVDFKDAVKAKAIEEAQTFPDDAYWSHQLKTIERIEAMIEKGPEQSNE